MQQWLNMQMCLKASVLCRPWGELHTPVAPLSVFGAAIQPDRCARHWSNCAWTQGGKVTPVSFTGWVASLSVVAGRNASVSCSNQVYSKCDSWTSGYRPHTTQLVNLGLVVDLNLTENHLQYKFYLAPHFWCKLCLAATVERQHFSDSDERRSGQHRPKGSLMQQKRTRKQRKKKAKVNDMRWI